MGLHNTAHYLKSKGRGTDTELVHMSKREIKGLQQLAMAAGGSLTINPDTGLVEAGFLERALPLVAAAAATYFTAGAAAPAIAGALGSAGMSAAAAGTAGGILAGAGSGALISGGMAAAQGQDVGQAALMGGVGGAVAGGLGAYGDASTFADATQKAALDAGTQTAGAGVTEGAVQSTTGVAGTGAPTGFVPPTTPTPAPTAAGIQAAAPGAARNAALEQLATNTGTLAEGSSKLAGAGLQTAPAPAGSFYAGLEPYGVGRGAIQALPVASLAEQGPTIGGQEPEEPMGYGLSANFKRYEPTRPNPYYQAQYPTYAAEGGIMQSYAVGGNVAAAPTGPVERLSQNVMGGADTMYPQSQQTPTKFATPTQMPVSSEMVQQNEYNGVTMAKGGLPTDAPTMSNMKMFSDSDANTRGLGALEATNYRNKKLMGKAGIKMAQMPQTGIKSLGGDFSDVGAAGGTAHLGDYSDGGRLLKGPGDGMSDNIPATIGRKQPARLADGEFVVPADVVSHLGNGSTDAGAKKLYAMMDKIRRARTGKKKQAPAVKADKYLPA